METSIKIHPRRPRHQLKGRQPSEEARAEVRALIGQYIGYLGTNIDPEKNKLRGEEVKFSEGTLEHIGRLMFLLPKERAIIYTYENGKPVRHTVPFNEIWM